MLAPLINFVGKRGRSPAWVRVAFTTKQGLRGNPVFLSRLRSRLFGLLLRDSSEDTPDIARFRYWFSSDFGLGRPRFPLAASVAGIEGIELAEFRLRWSLLPKDFDHRDLDQQLIPCLVAPGPRGPVRPQPMNPDDVAVRVVQRLEIVGRRGVPVAGVLVQANRDLFASGPRDLPVDVLIRFGPDATRSRPDLETLAHRFHAWKCDDPPPRTRAERTMAKALRNETARYHRRRTVPPELTGGEVIYLADLWIRRQHLPDGYLTEAERWIRCVAEPGRVGGIEHLPYHDSRFNDL